MANANVYYELGIRHATRPWSTVLLFRDDFSLPFDVAAPARRALPAQPGGRPASRPRGTPTERRSPQRLRERALAQDGQPAVPELDRPGAARHERAGRQLFREQVEAVTALQNRLGAARRSRDLDAMRAVQAELGDLDDTEAGLMIDLLQSYLAVEA